MTLVTPVNYRKQDAGAEAIARDVDYALQVIDFYLRSLPDAAAGLVDRDILELGPGYSLGTATLLACHGARVSVADRYLAAWDADYHSAFYRALLERLSRDRRELDPEPILLLLRAGKFVEEVLACHHHGSEELDRLPEARFDAVFSNAVLEHVEDIPRAVAQLARLTRRGGLGVHQVDFRDHRDYSRPLEFLTVDRREFRAMFVERRGECGNRWRAGAMAEQWREHGFDVVDFNPNMVADPSYLQDVAPRLHADYAQMDHESLAVISGCFVVRRSGEGARALADSAECQDFAGQLARGRRVLLLGGAESMSSAMLASGALSCIRADAAIELPLPYEAASFELVCALGVIGQRPDATAWVGELRRVLTSDGLALLSVAHGQRPELSALVGMLDIFEWVDFYRQVELSVRAIVPMEAASGATSVQWKDYVPTDGTAVIAVCRAARTSQPLGAFIAVRHELGPAGALQAEERPDPARRQASFIARNGLRWSALRL